MNFFEEPTLNITNLFFNNVAKSIHKFTFNYQLTNKIYYLYIHNKHYRQYIDNRQIQVFGDYKSNNSEFDV